MVTSEAQTDYAKILELSQTAFPNMHFLQLQAEFRIIYKLKKKNNLSLPRRTNSLRLLHHATNPDAKSTEEASNSLLHRKSCFPSVHSGHRDIFFCFSPNSHGNNF